VEPYAVNACGGTDSEQVEIDLNSEYVEGRIGRAEARRDRVKRNE
jgi:hypothetical protein